MIYDPMTTLRKDSFTIGVRVRVWTGSRDCSQRATIALDNEDETFEVIFDDGLEESSVPKGRIQYLEAFEIDSSSKEPLLPPATRAGKAKENGNHLFQQCKDWNAAMAQYNQALTLLIGASGLHKSEKFSMFRVGSLVLVTDEKSVETRAGMISATNLSDYTVDLMYEDDNNEEEENVALDRLTLLTELQYRDIQRACYLNLARCATKKCSFGWAIRYSSIAFCIVQMMTGEENMTVSKLVDFCKTGATSLTKQAADAILVRGKALLSAGRPGLAQKDAELLCMFDRIKGTQFIAEIAAFRKERFKLNKKLSRDVVNWVSQAMTIAENKGAKVEDEQLALELEDVECEEHDNMNTAGGEAPTSRWFW